MNYELIELKEKTVVGIKTRTSNTDPNMSNDIGTLWQNFFEKGIFNSIADKKNNNSIGLYTNYENTANEYDVMVCCEVKDLINQSKDLQSEIIPSGKYAKFIINGHVQTAVQEFWMNLCNIKLDRKYSHDFEEYQDGGDMNNAEIHIYISLN